MTLIDTSVWVEALRKDGRPGFKERVKQLMLARQASVCEMVLLELWNGARGEAEQRSLAAIEGQVKLLPLSPDVWRLAYRLARYARAQGLTVPASDVVIDACARYYEADLYQNDSHFELIRTARV